MYEYDAADIKRLFGLSAASLNALIRAGHIQPVPLPSGCRYSFHDLLLLRTVSALRAARIPARQIHKALRSLRASLPSDIPMSRLALDVVGQRIGVRDGSLLWEANTSQYALPLEVASRPSTVSNLDSHSRRAQSGPNANQHFARGVELEDSDLDAARAAYESCLTLEPEHGEARINLGRLLHLSGLLADAERIYRGAAEPSALLSFNLAVLLEDLQRSADAIDCYNEALAQDPGMADAHFNLARLYESAGNAQASFRHLLAYRRLSEKGT
jgi:tetratricopeptide (TPR) repeat protein